MKVHALAQFYAQVEDLLARIDQAPRQEPCDDAEDSRHSTDEANDPVRPLVGRQRNGPRFRFEPLAEEAER